MVEDEKRGGQTFGDRIRKGNGITSSNAPLARGQGPALGMDNLPIDTVSRHRLDSLNTSNDFQKKRMEQGSHGLIPTMQVQQG